MAMRPIFYDTETTGLKSKVDKIVEIAAYDPELDRSFCEFVNPGVPIPPDASSVHGITQEMVESAPDFGEVGRRFAEFCDGDILLIAHNQDGFDIHFIRAEFGRHDIPMPEWKTLDTLKWARKYRPDLPSHSLQFLREMYGIEANNAHRALDDVMVLYKVYLAMIDDLSTDQVYELLCQQKKIEAAVGITEMPFGKHRGQPLDKVPKNYVKWLASDGAFDSEENAALKAGFQKLGLI